MKAKNPRKVKAALKNWVARAEKLNPDPLGFEGAPPWVERALAEVIKTIMPGRKLTLAGEWDLELIGELLGRTQALGKLFAGEIPFGPEMKAGQEQVEKVAATLPKSPALTALTNGMLRDFQASLETAKDGIPSFMGAALDSSYEDALKYQKGLSQGMNLAPDKMTPEQTFQRHTQTFLLIVMQWRRFSKCRSVGEVHRILCKEHGKEKIGSLKTFENRVAKKIGMRFGRSGRPPKRK